MKKLTGQDVRCKQKRDFKKRIQIKEEHDNNWQKRRMKNKKKKDVNRKRKVMKKSKTSLSSNSIEAVLTYSAY